MFLYSIINYCNDNVRDKFAIIIPNYPTTRLLPVPLYGVSQWDQQNSFYGKRPQCNGLSFVLHRICSTVTPTYPLWKGCTHICVKHNYYVFKVIYFSESDIGVIVDPLSTYPQLLWYRISGLKTEIKLVQPFLPCRVNKIT